MFTWLIRVGDMVRTNNIVLGSSFTLKVHQSSSHSTPSFFCEHITQYIPIYIHVFKLSIYDGCNLVIIYVPCTFHQSFTSIQSGEYNCVLCPKGKGERESRGKCKLLWIHWLSQVCLQYKLPANIVEELELEIEHATISRRYSQLYMIWYI